MHRYLISAIYVLFVSSLPRPLIGQGAGHGQPGAGGQGAAQTSLAIPADAQKRLDIVKGLLGSVERSDKRPVDAILQSKAKTFALQKVRTNDIAGAKEALAAVNPFQPAAILWNLHMAQSWLEVADDISKQSDRRILPTIVALVFEQLDFVIAHGAGPESGSVLQAHMMKGRVQERYNGDYAGAVRSYKAALLVRPGDEGARDALQRLERSLSILHGRRSSGR